VRLLYPLLYLPTFKPVMPAPAARASVKLVIRDQKARADGTCPIYIRVTSGRKTRYTATGVYVKPRLWNETRQEVRATHELATSMNERLQTLANEARTLALRTPSADAVKAGLDGSGGSLTGYFERFIADLDRKGALWEWKKYRVTLGKLQACLGSELSWGDVDRAALVRFERYLRQQTDEKKANGPNTVRKELARLRRVYRQALRDGEIRPAEDPFLTYERPRGQRVERRKLTLEEVEKLAALGAARGLAAGSFEEIVRDAFVFQFYAAGMRFSDVACLRASDVTDGRVTYRMLKTGTPVSIPLPPPALAIAAEYAATAGERGGYLFPLLRAGDDRDGVHLRQRISSRNAQANEALKRLAALAEIEAAGLSTHVARHSYADYARRAGGDLYAISKSLGHGNLATTEVYLKALDRDAVDRLAGQLWT
jgi:integrase